MNNASTYHLLSKWKIKKIVAFMSTPFQFPQIIRDQNVGNFITNSILFFPLNVRVEFAGRTEAFIRCEKYEGEYTVKRKLKIYSCLCVLIVKVHPSTGHEGQDGEYRYSSTLSLTSVIDGGRWSTPRSGRFTPGNYPVPTA
jgi:hypothetical protein